MQNSLAVANPTHEIERERPQSGWLGVGVALLLALCGAYLILTPYAWRPFAGGACVLLAFFLAKGLLVLEPNASAVLTFFGNYVATIRRDGFFWVNPFYHKRRVSLRVENFNTPTLKVNDRLGNPIEIAAVITWRVQDTAQAVFDVEDYARYIHVQSEMGLREVAGSHAYDGDHDREVTLRCNFQAISKLLTDTIQDHVAIAGIMILEAKITHLAYAPEIAGVMLRRQQAEAVVQAREKLVEGAIGMVKTALARLEAEAIARLTLPERAALVTNMMTVLLSEEGAQPVIQMTRAQE
jgi:regulator of protease activity HflC (stomatin/prohibitin superfamily)